MKFTHIATKAELQKGVKRHLAHRYPIRRVIGPALGIFCIFCGLFLVINGTSTPYRFLGAASIAIGLSTTARWWLHSRKTVSAAFKGRQEGRTINYEALEDELHVADTDSNGALRWEAFVDARVYEDGILLYPQNNLFYWIPIKADFETGNWEQLIELIERKIEKKA